MFSYLLPRIAFFKGAQVYGYRRAGNILKEDSLGLPEI